MRRQSPRCSGPPDRPAGLVPSDLIQVLGFSPRVELQSHFRSARALASTSSAGTSETSPRSIWSARRAASSCHSSSASSDRGVSRLSSNWRTRRARSSTGRFNASSAMAFKSTPPRLADIVRIRAGRSPRHQSRPGEDRCALRERPSAQAGGSGYDAMVQRSSRGGTRSICPLCQETLVDCHLTCGVIPATTDVNDNL